CGLTTGGRRRGSRRSAPRFSELPLELRFPILDDADLDPRSGAEAQHQKTTVSGHVEALIAPDIPGEWSVKQLDGRRRRPRGPGSYPDRHDLVGFPYEELATITRPDWMISSVSR